MSQRPRFGLFLALFFLSGACGLVYEIVWSRLLVLVIGGTTYAITTVLACFMGGLALGSWIGGRWGSTSARPQRLYGLLEIAIGVYCAAVPFLLDAAIPLYRWLGGGTGARILVSAAVLVVPTTLMGATLPILSGAFVRRSDRLARRVAALYGWNTIGAFAGCVAAGFVLVPAVGLRTSIWIAACANVAVGVLAIFMSRAAGVADSGPRPRAATPAPLIGRRPLLLLYGLSGVAAMAYQVAWTRALILSMGSSTYAFSAIVACFILGLASGSLIVASRGRPIERPLLVAGGLQAAIALGALVVVPLFGELPGLVERISSAPGATFARVLSIETACVLGLLAVPTVCMGALMPVVCRIYAPDEGSAGAAVGAVYAANTAGTIVGALVAGFVLIPSDWFGMQRTIVAATAVSGAIATVFLLADRPVGRRRAVWVVGLWVVGILVASVTGPWARSVMVSGPYLARNDRFETVLFYEEGVDTTVAVTSRGGLQRSLHVNGKPDASNLYRDKVTQLLLAHVPMLLHPRAEQVYVVGLGSGATAGAVLGYPVREVEVAEVSRAVLDAAVHFEDINNGVLRDERVTVHRADARNHLLLTEKRFDVVISEPSNPWMSGVANLFTREAFEIVRDRLEPGGLYCQWLQGYSIGASDVGAVLATFSSVFPHAQIWEAYLGEFLLVGSLEPIAIDTEMMHVALARPDVSASLAEIFIQDPLQLAHHYVTDATQLSGWLDEHPVLTDDRPRLEFSATRYLLKSDLRTITQRLTSGAGFPEFAPTATTLPREFRATIQASRRRRALEDDLTPERLAVWVSEARIDPRILFRAVRMVGSESARAAEPQRMDMAEQRIREAVPDFEQLEKLTAGEPAAPSWPFARRFGHGDLPAATAAEIRDSLKADDMPRAVAALLRMLVLSPADPRAYLTLAGVYCGANDAAKTAALIDTATANGVDTARLHCRP